MRAPVEPAPVGRGLPRQGPETWVVSPRRDRLYGPDGSPIKGIDLDHDHEQGHPGFRPSHVEVADGAIYINGNKNTF